MLLGACGEQASELRGYADLYNRVWAGWSDLQKGIDTVPGFGGIRFGFEKCEVAVFLEEPRSAAARQAAVRAFGHELYWFERNCGGIPKLRYEPARAKYATLDSLRQAAVAHWDGFTIADVDPLAGRIVFNVSATRDLDAARDAIRRARIPRGAYELHVAGGFDHISPGVYAIEFRVRDETAQPVTGFAIVLRKDGVVQDSIVSDTSVFRLDFEFPRPEAAARYTVTVIPPPGYAHCLPARPIAAGLRMYPDPALWADDLVVTRKAPDECRLSPDGS